jgi:hypothetical protein
MLKRICGWFRGQQENNLSYGTAKSGFNNRGIMIEWIQIVFQPETRPEARNEGRPPLFDGSNAHLDPDIVYNAVDHNIICFSMPSHCTHEGQPVDKAVLRPWRMPIQNSLRRSTPSSPKNASRNSTLSLGVKHAQRKNRFLASRLLGSTYSILPRFWRNPALKNPSFQTRR